MRAARPYCQENAGALLRSTAAPLGCDQESSMDLGTLPYDQIVRHVHDSASSGRLAFVARVNSPWTMHGLETWLDAFWDEPTREGLVIAMPSTLDGEAFVPTPTVEHLSSLRGVNLVRAAAFGQHGHSRQNARRALNFPGAALHGLWSSWRRGDPLTLISPRLSDLTFYADLVPWKHLGTRPVRFVLLDEGYGCLEAPGWVSLGFHAKNAARRVLFSKVETIEHFVVRQAHPLRRYFIDEAVAAGYRASITRHRAPLDLARRSGDRFALLLTTYYAEIGVTTAEIERRMVADLVRLLEHQGYRILVKHHPRERAGKYDGLPEIERVRILDQAFGAESYYPHLAHGDVVVGFLSNALFSAQTLFGLDVFMIPGSMYGITYSEAHERIYSRVFPKGLPTLRDLESAQQRVAPLRATP
jgi:hypothetical protein